jgi:hypothetical protein
MNKHKEALQKIVDFKPTLKGIFIDDLIDEINSLKNIATEALQSSEWISVEDRLPENTNEVLVAVKYQNEPILVYYGSDKKWYGSRETRDWMIDGYCQNAEINKCIEITHWMPLPQAPSLQPKTEEKTLTEHWGIKEQPTSPSIEKMNIEEWLLKNNYQEISLGHWVDKEDSSGRLYTTTELYHLYENNLHKLKANNSLGELEIWVKAQFHPDNKILLYPLISKIQELKTKQ